MQAAQVRRRLKELAVPEKAVFLPRFFKTGPGEYGEGDRFLGVTVPRSRKVARAARGMSQSEIRKLLDSEWHEERFVGLLVLVDAFQHAPTEKERRDIYRFYVRHLSAVNNWDLVDGSAPQIVGGYLKDKDRKQLHVWARSRNLWKRRIAVLATFTFIRAGDFRDIFVLATALLSDKEDLMHKAVGWMLREVGNRDRAAEERFLRKCYKKMPRTMLRYAIEKLPESRRQAYLKGRV